MRRFVLSVIDWLLLGGGILCMVAAITIALDVLRRV